MTDTSKERNKRGKGPWAALISAIERSGKRVKSFTVTFEDGKQMNDTDAELAEFEKRMRDGEA